MKPETPEIWALKDNKKRTIEISSVLQCEFTKWNLKWKMVPETPKRTRLSNDVKLAIIEAAKKKGGKKGYREEAMKTCATMRCTKSLLNEGFYEDDDFYDPSWSNFVILLISYLLLSIHLVYLSI